MYELIFITDPLTEKIDAESMAKVRNFITGLGGYVKKENVWEKRKLAYSIKKHLSGFYVVFEFEMEAERIDELQKRLKLDEDILRFLIINKEGIKGERPRVRPLKPKAAAPTRPLEAKGEKVKIEELDKKLEEILKE